MLRPEDGRDRGQLLVIIALVLGMVFVALAIVVNAAIFTENLATRETVDSERTAAFTGDVERALAVRYNRTNAKGSHTASDARETFDDTFRTWTDQRSNVSATEGGFYDADWTTHVGWRLNQSSDDSFAPADNRDATEWTVVEDTRNVSMLRLNVTRDDLHDASSASDVENAFRLSVSDGSMDWELYVFQDSNDIVVHQGTNPGGFASLSDLLSDSDTCKKRNTDRTVIDFLTLKVGDVNCPVLAFEDDLSGPVTIRYENVNVSGTERINGTYTVVVNGSGAVPKTSGEPTHFNRSGEAPPTASAVVYTVDYETTYERADVEHHRKGRYAPRAALY
jgi:hypothetical protein